MAKEKENRQNGLLHAEQDAKLLLIPIQTGWGGWGGGGGGGVGAFDATQDLNPLLLTNDCVYSVPTSWIFLNIYLEKSWCC